MRLWRTRRRMKICGGVALARPSYPDGPEPRPHKF
jgi:hypothetical protein